MISDKEINAILKNSYDLHLHIGPDILPRKYVVEEIIKKEDGKIKGIALKAHAFPTISAISAAKKVIKTKLDLIGSLTLNYFMGGFNTSAVYASAVMSRDFPVIVWFPTVHAENHLTKNYSRYEIPPEWVRDPKFKPRLKTELRAIKVTDWNGKLFHKCVRVLKMIKKMNCILATGHLSWQEAKELALVSLRMGIKVIVTHPNQRDITMPLKVQKQLAEKGAFIEHCYVMYLDRDNKGDYPLKEQVKWIRSVGAKHCILTSDAGQSKNPSSTECLREYIKLLARHGITKKEFKLMLVDNPRKLLGK